MTEVGIMLYLDTDNVVRTTTLNCLPIIRKTIRKVRASTTTNRTQTHVRKSTSTYLKAAPSSDSSFRPVRLFYGDGLPEN